MKLHLQPDTAPGSIVSVLPRRFLYKCGSFRKISRIFVTHGSRGFFPLNLFNFFFMGVVEYSISPCLLLARNLHQQEGNEIADRADPLTVD